MEIPKPIDTVVAAIDAALESKPSKPRPHLGASLVGGPCERAIWYIFRWATIEKFSGKILRLFARGSREEEHVVKLLKDAGIQVEHTGYQQKRVDFSCHVSGSLDGIITGGLPDAPKSKHILEIKTHNKKSFDELEKKGVKEAKPAHYAQMQIYMYGTYIDRALYFAVCKDDDRIYTERVKLDKDFAKDEVYRAKKIALAPIAPMRLSENPAWYQCKYCPSLNVCQYKQPTEHKNCRTCTSSVPQENGAWACREYGDKEIPLDFQYKGCNKYQVHPDLGDEQNVLF